MARRLFTLLPVASLLLCAATVVLWFRAWGFRELIQFQRWAAAEQGAGRFRSINVEWDGGGVGVRRFTMCVPGYRGDRDAERANWHYQRSEIIGWPEHGGWRFRRRSWGPPASRSEQVSLSVPWWSVVCLTGLLPAAWYVARRRRCRQAKAGFPLCPACGYDLRATPGRCPECGTAAPLPERAT